jgi:sec-independent protein translocase protein TatB
MFGLGMSEIIFLGVLALIVIGPKELPELARTLGRFLNELKRSTSTLTDDFKQQTGFDKLSKLDYFEDRKNPDVHQAAEEPGATEADEDLYPLHKKEKKPQNPEQLELLAQDETDTTKGPKES